MGLYGDWLAFEPQEAIQATAEVPAWYCGPSHLKSIEQEQIQELWKLIQNTEGKFNISVYVKLTGNII